MSVKQNADGFELPELFTKIGKFQEEILPYVKDLANGKFTLDQFAAIFPQYYPFLVDYPLALQQGAESVSQQGYSSAIQRAIRGEVLVTQKWVGFKGSATDAKLISDLKAGYSHAAHYIDVLVKYFPNHITKTGVLEEFARQKSLDQARGSWFWQKIDQLMEEFNISHTPISTFFILLGYLANTSQFCKDVIAAEIGYALNYILRGGRLVIPAGHDPQEYFERRLSKIYRWRGRYNAVNEAVKSFESQHWAIEDSEILRLIFFLKGTIIKSYPDITIHDVRKTFLQAFLYSPRESSLGLIKSYIADYPGIVPEISFSRYSILASEQAVSDVSGAITLAKVAHKQRIALNQRVRRIKRIGMLGALKTAVDGEWIRVVQSKIPVEEVVESLPKELIFEIGESSYFPNIYFARVKIGEGLTDRGFVGLTYEYLDRKMNFQNQVCAGFGMTLPRVCTSLFTGRWNGSYEDVYRVGTNPDANIKTVFSDRQKKIWRRYVLQVHKLAVEGYARKYLQGLADNELDEIVNSLVSQFI